MTSLVAVIWRYPFTEIEQLELLPGAETLQGAVSGVSDLSGDGQTLVGSCAGTNGGAVKWDKTSLSISKLPDVGGLAVAVATACSQDGSIIYGDRSDPHESIIRYTGGGAIGTELVPPTPYDRIAVAGFIRGNRRCSDDGSVSFCTAYGAPGGFPPDSGVRYDITTPTLLTVTPSPRCISQNAEIICGDTGLASSGAFFWRGTTNYSLPNPSTSGVPNQTASTCNGNGTVIWGQSVNDSTGYLYGVACYWDNLTTLTNVGGYDYYGVVHFLDLLPGATAYGNAVSWCAETTSPIAVGYGTASDSLLHGIKWVGTTAIDLPPFTPGSSAQATGCSADGSLVVGYDGWPLYWDTAVDTTPHKLPTLPLQRGGYALGVSRDGSTIYGLAFLAEPGQLELVSLYPYDQPTSIYGFTADSDFPLSFSQFSIAAWYCEKVHIQSPDSAITMDFSPNQIVISIHDLDGSLRFSGAWGVSSPSDEYQVLFSVDTVAQIYTLYVNDEVPTGSPTWGDPGPIGWEA